MNRRKSAKVISEDLAKINQVSGSVRSGKDSSTVAASSIVKEHTLRKERKELSKLEHDLYIYDFEEIKSWLDRYGKRFFVASEYRIEIQYKKMLRNNQCFIADYWKKKVNYINHYRGYVYKSGKQVPDVAFRDGLTPGGVHFLKMLKRYVLLYMYHNYVPNFVMSNQPILEQFQVQKKSGRITSLFSKILSQDYFKLKEETPIPFPMRGFVIETETAILYSNTDKKGGEDFKDKTGMREFYTTAGHILRETVYVYGITQSHTRTLLALRELYPGYQHVFKMSFKATADFTRSIIRFRIFMKKFKILRTRFYRWYWFLISKRAKFIQKIFKNRQTAYFTKRIYKLKKKISRLSQKETYKWSRGYIVFYKGIYEHIKDVGRKVSFPLLGVIHESKKDSTSYQTYGFKQTVKITDCFGRYDTHFMYTVREAKEILYDMHYTDVTNWENFKVKFEHMQTMNYETFNQLMNVVINHLKGEEIQRKRKLKELRKNAPLPPLNKLTPNELGYLIIDFGLQEKVDKTSKTLKKDMTDLLIIEYKKFRKDVLIWKI